MQSKTTIGLLTAAAVLVAAGAISAQPLAAHACGSGDTPETGIQGDVPPAGGANCGLTLLSQLPTSGAGQGAGHCAYVRNANGAYGSNGVIRTFSLADPENPVEVDSDPLYGGSESLRAHVDDDRAILVSGKGVYDVSNCEDPVFKGEIQWPSTNSKNGALVAATNSHEIAISHDGLRVYSGLGFATAHLEDLEDPSTWQVYNLTCSIGRQAGYPQHVGEEGSPTLCDINPSGDYQPQYSHSSDDNLEGTRWYGAHQNGGSSSLGEDPTLRFADITGDRRHPVLLGSLEDFPGHSLDWWRSPDGREWVVGANELGTGDTCADHPRETRLNFAADAYIAEVTGDVLRHASRVSIAINEPENCLAATTSNGAAAISESDIYNKHGAAMLMMEWGKAGLRVFDVRDGDNPAEVAYFSKGSNVHSAQFHYDEARGIILQPASSGLRVLEVQPQVIAALGLPTPTDPAYPRYPNGLPATPPPSARALPEPAGVPTLLLLSLAVLALRGRHRSCSTL